LGCAPPPTAAPSALELLAAFDADRLRFFLLPLAPRVAAAATAAADAAVADDAAAAAAETRDAADAPASPRIDCGALALLLRGADTGVGGAGCCGLGDEATTPGDAAAGCAAPREAAAAAGDGGAPAAAADGACESGSSAAASSRRDSRTTVATAQGGQSHSSSASSASCALRWPSVSRPVQSAQYVRGQRLLEQQTSSMGGCSSGPPVPHSARRLS